MLELAVYAVSAAAVCMLVGGIINYRSRATASGVFRAGQSLGYVCVSLVYLHPVPIWLYLYLYWYWYLIREIAGCWMQLAAELDLGAACNRRCGTVHCDGLCCATRTVTDGSGERGRKGR